MTVARALNLRFDVHTSRTFFLCLFASCGISDWDIEITCGLARTNKANTHYCTHTRLTNKRCCWVTVLTEHQTIIESNSKFCPMYC
ncbi:hypothetical protein HDV62DRAFT_169632 [Trichoderma sp. SZMC 28011]